MRQTPIRNNFLASLCPSKGSSTHLAYMVANDLRELEVQTGERKSRRSNEQADELAGLLLEDNSSAAITTDSIHKQTSNDGWNEQMRGTIEYSSTANTNPLLPIMNRTGRGECGYMTAKPPHEVPLKTAVVAVFEQK